MIGPSALTFFKRHFELGFAFGVGLVGGYWLILGGYVFTPLGALLIAVAAPWAIAAYRRLRFVQSIASEGLIEVVEGELRFFAPDDGGGRHAPMGGFLNLPDLAELRLLHLDSRRFWRMKTVDGQALMVPVDAAGHDALFDVFAALPGMDDAALIHALTHAPATPSATQTLWRRPHAGPALRDDT